MSQTASFDPTEHIYALDQVPVASTTGILRAVGLTSSYEYAGWHHRYRGSAVHLGSAIVDQGGTPRFRLVSPYDKDPDCVKTFGELPGYMEAFASAKASLRFQGAVYECALVHPRLRYGGMFDMAGYWMEKPDARKVLPDLKSGTYPVMTVVQLVAYEKLIMEGIPCDPNHPGLEYLLQVLRKEKSLEKFGLQLDKSGKFKSHFQTSKGHHYDDPMFVTAWNSAVFLYNHVPDHHFIWTDDYGKPHKKSRLSDLKWTAEQIRSKMSGKERETALKAGQNLWCLREQYGLLGKQ